MFKVFLLVIFGIIWCSKADISNDVIDLSHWNDVDFAKVKTDGIVAVIHKATEGRRTADKKYASRRALAEKQGLLWGAYHFAIGGNPVEQADHFLKTVGNNTNGVLLMLDLEERKGPEMTPDEAEQFVKRIKEKTGRYPMLYGTKFYLRPFNKPHLNKCSLWIAHYTGAVAPNLPEHRTSWVLWQYTDGKVGGTPKTVNGIGPCDRNRYNGPAKQLRNSWPHL